MSKISKISIGILAVVIIGFAYYFFFVRNKTPEKQTESNVVYDSGFSEKVNDQIVPKTAPGSQVVAKTASSFVLNIPKINKSAPIVMNVDGNNKEEYNKALEVGVAHMARTALPGTKGNSVIFGHSSYYANKPGNYKEVFATLNQLAAGDEITISSEGNNLSYKVLETKIVPPTDISIVEQESTKSILTIITCWPPKTTTNRFVVIAEKQ